MSGELTHTVADKSFVRRDKLGLFKESDDVGRSLAGDQQHKPLTRPSQLKTIKGLVMWTETLDRHAKPWNAEDIEQLGGLLFRGKTIPQIATTMGRTQEAVRGKAQALDMLPKRAPRQSISGAASSAFFGRGR